MNAAHAGRAPRRVAVTSARRAWLVVAAVAAVAGCDGGQSALHPHGQDAQAIDRITGVLMLSGGLILATMTAIIGVAVFGAPRLRARMATSRWVIGGGIAFPLIALSALLVYSLAASEALSTGDAAAVRVRITAEQWFWRVEYLHADGTHDVASANELHLPVGEPIEVQLASPDVIHSFWVPALAGKLDVIPGRVNRMRLRALDTGVFRGQCAEYCGGPHAWMALQVVVQPQAEFDAWLARQRAPVLLPEPPLARGYRLFIDRGCGVCHTVRGTAAAGTRGPDLTHVGSRLTLGAGVLANGAENLAAWVAASQRLKPGNLMPSFETLPGEELRSIADWLRSLE